MSSMPRNIPATSTSMRVSANHHTSSGVISGASRVEAVVIPTEYATSPRHRYDIMLLETPPGQHPTSIMPIERYGLRLNIMESPHAIIGISVYCANAPMRMSNGRRNSSLKSSTLSVSPIVSMIMPRIMLDTSPFTQENVSGRRNATMAASIT